MTPDRCRPSGGLPGGHQPVLRHLPQHAFEIRLRLPGEEGEVMDPEERQAGEPTNCIAG